MDTSPRPERRAPLPPVRLSPEGRPFTTSVDVAAVFGKRHDHVLRDIARLLADLLPLEGADHAPRIGGMIDVGAEPASTAGGVMFEPTTIEVALGKGATRRDPAYNLSRDGFALLAMGFTGRQALAFKLAYIAAFNAMEAKLGALYVAPLPSDREFTRGIRLKDKLLLHRIRLGRPREPWTKPRARTSVGRPIGSSTRSTRRWACRCRP